MLNGNYYENSAIEIKLVNKSSKDIILSK